MVNNITILFVLKPLLYKKEWIHLAEISRELKVHHTTLRKYFEILEKNGVVIKQKKGRLTLFMLNYDNPILIDFLVLVEKQNLINFCKELLLKEIVSFLHNIANEVIIFGSAVKNIGKANDIDLLIVGKFDKNELKKFEKSLGLNFHIINVTSLDEISKSLKKEIENKHLIIQNTENIVKWMLKN